MSHGFPEMRKVIKYCFLLSVVTLAIALLSSSWRTPSGVGTQIRIAGVMTERTINMRRIIEAEERTAGKYTDNVQDGMGGSNLQESASILRARSGENGTNMAINLEKSSNLNEGFEREILKNVDGRENEAPLSQQQHPNSDQSNMGPDKIDEATRSKKTVDNQGGANGVKDAPPLSEQKDSPPTVFRRRRVKVIRKTMRNGKVIREEVLGVKTVIVDDKDQPVKDERQAYDEVWYGDILKGHYSANTIHLANMTKDGPFLTEQLWKFDEPNSERLFLFNKLLQHYWKRNDTNVMNLRKELWDTGIYAPENLALTRKNAQVGTRFPLYANTRVTINNTVQSVSHYEVTENLRNHLPDVSPFRDTLYKRCAVIGNSGVLLNSSCGADIDSYDMVFRCNAAPIAEHTRDAGSRTNVTTFNPSIFYKKFNGLTRKEDKGNFHESIRQYNGYLWMTCMGAASMNGLCLSVVESNEPQKPDEPQLLVANAQEMVKFWDFWKLRNFSKLPSTGFYIAHSAIQLCEEAHLYGFWPFPLRLDTEFERVRYHYFDDILVGKQHGMNDEFSIFVQYHELGIVRLHTGKCLGR